MCSVIFAASFALNVVLISSQDHSRLYGGGEGSLNGNTNIANRNNQIPQYNITYIDKVENPLRVPVINENFEEHKVRRKTIKKSPKRTIQKIIKKNRVKTKKFYIHLMTHKTTQSPAKPEYDNAYAQEEQQWNDDQSTTQANQKKRPRKWNPKFARYPMPFQKMQKRDNYRYKRDADRDVYILKDLDEMEFLSSDKDYHVVNTHVKNYW